MVMEMMTTCPTTEKRWQYFKPFKKLWIASLSVDRKDDCKVGFRCLGSGNIDGNCCFD